MSSTKWILAFTLLGAVPAYADEPANAQQQTQMKMDELPAAVRTAVQHESKGKTVESITMKTLSGNHIYVVEVVSGNKGQDIEFNEAGKVLTRHAMHDESTETEKH
jgi:uncharacterized membrane protein YkoI